MKTEYVVYVDRNGESTGEIAPKLEAHNANTRIHSAFSCYIFNQKGDLLVTQRAHSKKVWPGVWTNSACGHPGPGESREDAIVRRVNQELGMKVSDLKLVLPTYTYKTPPFNGVIEHEFCPVYFAIAVTEPEPNPDEVADYKWLKWDDVKSEIANNSDDWSWWSKDQIKELVKKGFIS